MSIRKTIYIKQRAHGFAFAQVSGEGINLEWGESKSDGCGIFRKYASQPLLEPRNMCVPAQEPIPVKFPGTDYVFTPV